MLSYIEHLMDAILHRVPAVEQAEVRQVLNGPESITPDGLALLGEVPEVSRVSIISLIKVFRYQVIVVSFMQIRNYYVAAGMSSTGIMSAGGIGRVLVEWMAGGR